MSGPELGGPPANAPEPTPAPAPRPPEVPRRDEAQAAANAAAGQAQAAMAGAEAMFRSFSMAEQFMVGGALLILVVGEFLLGALLGGGGNFIAVVLASAELILAVWLKNRRSIQWPASYGLILSALVLAVVVPEFDDFLFWLHGLAQGAGVGSAIGLLTELVEWAGGVIMAWGAVLYWRSGGN